ncbi:glycosyltransferase family 2 protein [Candidatus Magnetominusculus xianensis]|uniref:Glycosyl transferase n=1 Tax=Candidatus Magnetominusculus xianensis TaxID=1748249 RepID=A0ABR5SKP9_9BACT|nr:glycosyltransferase [Candidatus Magnetominusculus xianensis]KWT92847.1 glycosyl transferase [Candidatus Magnetominusculus xianensis]MBF0403436.1 glycosyltransferase [Nitrospirota bacterium]
MKKPGITVVMPAYNHELYVAEAIESVLNQTFGDFEFIIINDGSKDATEQVIKKYKDPRIKYYSQENSGSHATINRGISMAAGDYISIINSDDAYHVKRLERLLSTAKEGGYVFQFTDLTLIDSQSNPIDDPEHYWIKWYTKLKNGYLQNTSPLKAILRGNYTISTSNFFFKAGLTGEIGLLNDLRYILDYDFAVRAMKHNEKGCNFLIGEKLLSYRLHGSNTILKDPVSAHIECYELITNTIKYIYGPEIHPAIDHLKEMTWAIKSIYDSYNYDAASAPVSSQTKLFLKKYIKEGTLTHKMAKKLLNWIRKSD